MLNILSTVSLSRHQQLSDDPVGEKEAHGYFTVATGYGVVLEYENDTQDRVVFVWAARRRRQALRG